MDGIELPRAGARRLEAKLRCLLRWVHRLSSLAAGPAAWPKLMRFGALAAMGWICRRNRRFRHALGAGLPGLAQFDDDLVASEAQGHAGLRAGEMHDDAGLVLQPQIAGSGRLEADLPGALDIGAGELGDVVELVDVAGDVELGDAARADHRADQLERIGLSLEGQRARADARAAGKNFGHDDPAGRLRAPRCSARSGLRSESARTRSRRTSARM